MKLEECRERMVNLAELARKMEYSRTYVNLVVNGKARPGKRFLRDLANIPVEAVIKHRYKKKVL
jgi:transcriptional regulator with XRE-family HTH domain